MKVKSHTLQYHKNCPVVHILVQDPESTMVDLMINQYMVESLNIPHYIMYNKQSDGKNATYSYFIINALEMIGDGVVFTILNGSIIGDGESRRILRTTVEYGGKFSDKISFDITWFQHLADDDNTLKLLDQSFIFNNGVICKTVNKEDLEIII